METQLCAQLAADNKGLQDVVLPDAEFEELNKLDKHKRFNLPFDWGVDIFDEVGEAEIERMAKEEAARTKSS